MTLFIYTITAILVDDLIGSLEDLAYELMDMTMALVGSKTIVCAEYNWHLKY